MGLVMTLLPKSFVLLQGSEVHRMYMVLLGKDGFRKGLRLYLDQNDGQAVACEAFLDAMSESSGRDLSGMARWYSQAGTPHVTVSTEYNAGEKTFRMNLKQQTPPTSDQPKKEPVLIPIAVGLLGPGGEDMPLKLKVRWLTFWPLFILSVLTSAIQCSLWSQRPKTKDGHGLFSSGWELV